MLFDSNEKTKILPQNYSYAKYILEIIKLCNIHKLQYEMVGFEDFEKIQMKYPIYKIIINPDAKKTFGIIGGVHPTEIAGSMSILQMLELPHLLFTPKIRYI